MLAEERRSMPVTSRRALLLASLAAPVLAVPVAAQTPTAHDAELIAMGAHLDATLPELHRRMDTANVRIGAAHAASRLEIEARDLKTDDEVHEVYIRHELAAGVHAPDADWETLSNSLGPLYRRAETLRANTLAGLRAKVLLTMENYSPNGQVDEVYGLDDLLSDLQRLCGIEWAEV